MGSSTIVFGVNVHPISQAEQGSILNVNRSLVSGNPLTPYPTCMVISSTAIIVATKGINDQILSRCNHPIAYKRTLLRKKKQKIPSRAAPLPGPLKCPMSFLAGHALSFPIRPHQPPRAVQTSPGCHLERPTPELRQTR